MRTMPEMAYFSSPFTLHLWILKNYRINIEGDVCLLLKLDLLSEMGKLESVKQQYTNEIIREEVKLIDAGTIVQKNFQFPQLQLLHKQIIIFIYVVYISKSFRIRGQIEKVKDTNRYKIFELLIRSTPMHGQSIDQQGKSNCQWATVVAPPLHLHSVSRNMDLNLRTVYYIYIYSSHWREIHLKHQIGKVDGYVAHRVLYFQLTPLRHDHDDDQNRTIYD